MLFRGGKFSDPFECQYQVSQLSIQVLYAWVALLKLNKNYSLISGLVPQMLKIFNAPTGLIFSFG